MAKDLLVGAYELDITPKVGTLLAGGIYPRVSKGIHDPLMAKAIVLEAGGTRLAYVILDICVLTRREGDKAVELSSQLTGIPSQNIIWATSHTHSGPYTMPFFGATEDEVVDKEWLSALPHKFAECVAEADKRKVPAKWSFIRGYNYMLPLNRRLRFKDGRELNNWLIDRGEDVQCVGTAGPVDPEIGILSFEDLEGNLIAVLFNFSLHLTTHFGEEFSADYPAVVARRIRERFGEQVITLYMPGAMGDTNTYRSMEETGNMLADSIIPKLEMRKPRDEAPILGAMKNEITVPYRDFYQDQEERIKASQWPEDVQEVFRKELEIMRKEGITEGRTIVSAWRIGEVAFAGLPGELFVEWGLKIKQESPFPWTFPVELCCDYQGYLVTEKAWEAGGYESLIARSAKPSPQGVKIMVDKVMEMLVELSQNNNLTRR
ncbi:hypothetical protein H5T87_04770 [bacterium]|nr:hypothetical protein [bacterium]